MEKLDIDWVKKQFKAARVRQISGDAVLKLLEAWSELDLPDSEEVRKDITDLFGKLAQGHAIIPEDGGQVWVDARQGAHIMRGDEVRVRADAFTGDEGKRFNGRRGHAVDVRWGDVIFRSTDELEPAIVDYHFAAKDLEKRIK